VSAIAVGDAAAADARAIATVHVRSWQEGYRGIVDDAVLDGLSVDDRERVWRERLAFAVRASRRQLGSPQSMKGRRMVKAVVLYGHPENPDAFERHYAETHTPLAEAIPGLRRFEAARGFATPDGSAVPYQRIAELTFDDMDALQAGMGSSEGQAAVDDLANFASGGVTIFFAEID
jgi:uncharacterized protein (TIGR02118 family)